MNMDIWVVGKLNQLLIKGSYTETKLKNKQQNKVVTDKRFFGALHSNTSL